MKFFVPHTIDNERAEDAYNNIVKRNDNYLGKILEKRIYSITYKHNGKKYHSCVGEMHEIINEPILAILESNIFLVCTPNRGVFRGEPILVGHDEIISVEEFD